ncbi:eukaryotic elongation factor 2 kinase-like [Patiria miniata]|uniref:Alpha-type protein kinase domain-containing protein n=1 Tax=Patiria miniata TaxID=46514 RepID=A0A914AGB8_PATMI|nr:eukaryotic elongation factor 2 kinase-like [Patiria miniata]
MGSYPASNKSKEIGLSRTRVEFEDDWFAQGASRRVYKGTFHGIPEKEGKRCVVKVYKEEWYEDAKDYAWKVDDLAYRKANEMAQLFNMHHTAMYPTSINRKIEFVKPEFTRVDAHATNYFLGLFPYYRTVKGKLAFTRDRVTNVIPSNASLLVERYLEGDYVKFTSNTGFVDPENGALPAAFSHFTYHASEGEILVSDLQGVMSDTRYTFTDPAVLSGGTELGVYGPTDLGKFGIIRFFKSHSCNELCKGLNKPQIFNVTRGEQVVMDQIVQNMSGKKSSTYTYQLSTSSDVPKSEVEQLQTKIELEAIPEESDSDVETEYHQSGLQQIDSAYTTLHGELEFSTTIDQIKASISKSMPDLTSSSIHSLRILSDSDSD